MQVFEYGEEEVAYLASRDARMAEAIAVIGHIEREVTPDLFASLVNCIVGQQISTKAQVTIWGRMLDVFAKYRRRYSPYGSVASLYLWEIASGSVPGLRDWVPKRTKGSR